MFIFRKLPGNVKRLTALILSLLLFNSVGSLQKTVFAESALDYPLIFEFRNSDGITKATSFNAGQSYEMRVYYHNDKNVSTITVPMIFNKDLITVTGYSDGAAFSALGMEHPDSGNTNAPYQLKTTMSNISSSSPVNTDGVFVLNFNTTSYPVYMDFDQITDLSAISDSKNHFFTVKFQVNAGAGNNVDPGFGGRITDVSDTADPFWGTDAMRPNKIHENIADPFDAPLRDDLIIYIIVPKELPTPTENITATPAITPTEDATTPATTATEEPTPTLTGIATEEITTAPVVTPTETETAAITQEPTAAVTETPAVTPTDGSTEAVTAAPEETATVTSAGTPTVTPTDIPTEALTGIPSKTTATEKPTGIITIPTCAPFPYPDTTQTAKPDPYDIDTGDHSESSIILFGSIILSAGLLLLLITRKDSSRDKA